jgi:hypothetical protein
MIVETLEEKLRAKFSPRRRSSVNKGNKQNELSSWVSHTSTLTKRLSIKVRLSFYFAIVCYIDPFIFLSGSQE